MSLWTPDGEHPVDRDRPTDAASRPAPDLLATLTEEQRAEFDRLSPEEQEQMKAIIAQMAETRRQMLETPAAVVVANHAMGLYELAAIHLSADTPKLDEAKIAIDAMAAIVNGLGERIGPDFPTVRDALAQIQLAFVQIRAGLDASQGADGGPAGESAGEAPEAPTEG
jgi:hypothetical protein